PLCYHRKLPMRSTILGLALIVVIGAGCATGGAQRSSAPAGAVAEPGQAGTSSDPRARDAAARQLLEQGRAAMAGGDMSTAARSLREALRLQPHLVTARDKLALALYEMGDLDGSGEGVGALLRRHPEAVRARLILATALMARQDWAAARTQLEGGLRRHPDPRAALSR